MTVVVEIANNAREDLFALLAVRTPTEGDAARFAAEYLEDIERQFREYQGPPPMAEVRVDSWGDVWWWHYANGIWTGYTVATQARRLFRPPVRTFRVVAFRARPPLP
jgi:hypothetical protein